MVDSREMELRWKLKSFLDSNGVTLYKVAQEMDGAERGNQSLLYRLNDGQRVEITTRNLERIMTGVQRATSKPVSVLDIVEEIA